MPWEFLGFRTCLFHERQKACFFMLNQKGYFFMLKLASTVAVLAVLSVAASAQPNVQVLTAVPMDSVTVSNWYKQSVYDPSNAKVGAVNDVLVDKGGKITALIVGVGGFLGAGEKDVAVPFDAVRVTTKDNNKWYLVMNATKDGLKAAPGYKYDKGMTTWVPDTK